MQITKADIALVLYGEITDEISRGNDDLVAEKIEGATGEVYSYLHRYDTATMFSAGWQNAHFKSVCCTVIAWHLSILCNPSVSIEVLRTNYEDSIKFLKSVRSGDTRPNWPLRPNDPQTNIDDAGNVEYSSNPKRTNHY